MRTFLVAVQLLTRVPVRLAEAPGRDEEARAAAWFPLVGAAVGLAAYGAFWLAERARVPSLGPFAALLTAVALTGAFHEDGLADAADGIFGGSTKEQRLAIMRDSRLGSYGVLALILVLGVQVTALGAAPRALVPRLVVAAHALGRAAALPLVVLPYARQEGGLGAALSQRVPPASLALGVALGAASLALLPWPLAVAAAVAAALVAGLAAARFARDLGGVTGDALGAVVKLVEVATYVVAAAFGAWRA